MKNQPIQILQGDCRETLKQIPDGTLHCCVTSPPYWGLRSYLPAGHDDKHREIGSEPTPDAYVQTMVEVFREVRRVLHDSGTVWLNVGDSYARQAGDDSTKATDGGMKTGRTGRSSQLFATGNNVPPDGLKPKDLCLIPWRLAIALQADGWWVRSIICWTKKSCMPESVTDRPTNSWEPIFLLAKSAKYFFDAEAVKEPLADESIGRGERFAAAKAKYGTPERADSKHLKDGVDQSCGFAGMASGRSNGYDLASGLRNQRNVWHLGPEPYAEAHFATFPTEIPRRAILAGTSAKGCCPKCYAPWTREETEWKAGCACCEQPIPCSVLDPFGGSGTTGQVAIELARNTILCELNPEYAKLIENRTNVTPGLALA